MKLLRTMVWSRVDSGCLKWSCLLLGMIGGTLLADVTRRHVWLLAAAAVLLAVRPALHYCGDKG
jgi:hypothetical protein